MSGSKTGTISMGISGVVGLSKFRWSSVHSSTLNRPLLGFLKIIGDFFTNISL